MSHFFLKLKLTSEPQRTMLLQVLQLCRLAVRPLTSGFDASSLVKVSLLQLLLSPSMSSRVSCATLWSPLSTFTLGGTEKKDTVHRPWSNMFCFFKHFGLSWHLMKKQVRKNGLPAKCLAYVHRKGALFMQASHTISCSSSGSSTEQPRCCRQTLQSNVSGGKITLSGQTMRVLYSVRF